MSRTSSFCTRSTLRDKLTALRQWCRDEYIRRTTALEEGTATMREQLDWAVPEYRLRFSEASAKAEEMGIKMNVVDLRLALKGYVE